MKKKWIRAGEKYPRNGQIVWYYKGNSKSPHEKRVRRAVYDSLADFPFAGDGPSVSHWMPCEEEPAPPTA